MEDARQAVRQEDADQVIVGKKKFGIGNFSNRQVSRTIFLILAIVPVLILYLFFVIYPVLQMFYLSFTFLPDMFQTPEWRGFENYRTLWTDKLFWTAFKNTSLMILIVTAVTFVLALYFGNLLAKKRVKGRSFYRILYYIPNILSIVVIAAIFGAIYRTPGGLLSGLLGESYKSPLDNQKTVIYGIIIAMIWQAFGYYMVMYIAAMDGIPDELYESCGLDGAGKTRQFFVITLPLTWEVVRVTLTFFIVGTIGMSFVFVDTMTGGGPLNSSHVLLTYMQSLSNSRSYGYAMSVGVVLFLFSYAVSLVINLLTKREVIEY